MHRPFAPGTEIGGRYEVRSLLGSGGTSSVYAAWDRELGRLVALKALRQDRMTPAAMKRFRREVAVAREAASPRLVRVHDIGTSGETLYLTMELVEGESLARRLKAGPLPVQAAVETGKEVLRALDDLHRLGVVHRDVKPANVLLGTDGSVKLADFGLARHWEGTETRATETEGIVGTMDYLAPEQALGREVDARADLFAFGVVLYEMLSGAIPFGSGSALGTVVARLRERAPDVRRLRKEVPRWLARVVERCLEKERAARYQTAADVLLDLERERGPGRRWTLRSIQAGLATAAVLVLGVAAIPFALSSWRRPPLLQTDGRWGLKAIDPSGRVLWRRSDIRSATTAALVRGSRGKRVKVAALLDQLEGRRADDETRAITLLDPWTGEATERHRLPGAAHSFPAFSDHFHPDELHAVDLDGSGDDVVVATFTHDPYYPSYAVLFEPATGLSRILLIHSGHVRLRGAFDLDGDGRKELLFAGTNNRMGRLTGLAAIRVPRVAAGREAQTLPVLIPVSSPDADRTDSSGVNLLWYALGPPAFSRIASAATFDPASRLMTLRASEAAWNLTVAGFAPGSSSRAEGERQAARVRAYRFLAEAGQREELGFPADSRQLSLRAVEEAEASGDRILTGWARGRACRAAIAAGESEAGEREATDLAAASDAPAEVAYEAAVAFHLAGQTDRAVRWYGWGLSRVSLSGEGRQAYEFVEGQLFALAGEGRWREAAAAVDRFDAAFPGHAPGGLYRSALAFLEGRRPPLLPPEAKQGSDLARYWALEARLAAGESLDLLSRELQVEKGVASGSSPLLLSLSSEIEARRGDRDAALEQALSAWNDLRAIRSRQTWARPHERVLAARLARLAERAGRADLVREVQEAKR